MLTRDAILEQLRAYLSEMFEIAPERVTLDAKLFEELDLDSIDAVDLIVKLQDLTKRRIEPQMFKAVRTVGDVVNCVEAVLAADAPQPS